MHCISLVEVSSTNFKTVLCTIEKILCEKDIAIEKNMLISKNPKSELIRDQ